MKVRAPELVGHGGWLGVESSLSLAALRGKVVVLHFWTAACINCQRTVDDLRLLQQRFEREVVVVGVHSPKFPHEGHPEAVRRAVARLGIAHPVLDDPDMVTWQSYGVRGWPTLVVISPRGHVLGALAGEGNGPLLDQIVQDLVEEGRAKGTIVATRLRQRPVEVPGPATIDLRFPGKVATDRRNRLAVADTGNDRVLVLERVGATGLRITHIVEGVHRPQGVRLYGSDLVICDTGGDRVVLVDLAARPGPEESVHPHPAGIIRLRVLPSEVIAPDVASPWDVVADVDRSYVVAEAGRHRLWRIPADGSSPGVIAGDGYEGLVDGDGDEAELAQPSGVTRLPNGIAFVDAESSSLRLLTNRGRVGTLVGEGLFDWGLRDGRPSQARLQHPQGVAAALDGTSLYVADTFNDAVRWWRDNKLVTIPTEGLCEPGGIDVLPDGQLVVADTGNHRLVLVDPDRGTVTPLVIERLRLAGEPAAPMWAPPLQGTAGEPLGIPFEVDLGAYRLDPADPAPVVIELAVEPSWLLDHGPRGWSHVRPLGELAVRAGSVGNGTLTVTVTASACGDGVCVTRRSITQHPLTVR